MMKTDLKSMSEKRRERSDMVKDIILAVKKGNNRSTMIAKASGLQYMRMSKLLSEMIEEGMLEKKGKEYVVTTRGMMELKKDKTNMLMERIAEKILEDPLHKRHTVHVMREGTNACLMCEERTCFMCGEQCRPGVLKDHADDCMYLELRKLCGEKK